MKRLLLILLACPVFGLDNSVTITDASASAQTARPTMISRFFAKGEFPSGVYPKPRIDGNVPSVWQVDPKTAWPDGSVQHAIISLRVSLPANGSVKVDFVTDVNPCHLGDRATCEAAALDEAGMLALPWNGKLTATLNSISYNGDARTMLDSGKFTYWLRGPVVTQVLVEDLTTDLAYNFGWQYNGSAWIEPTGDQYKSLRPAFDLAFWPDPDGGGALTAWPGVWVQARLYNDATTRQQRLPLSNLNFEVGSELATAWSMCSSGCTITGSPTMQARRSFRKDAWSGTAPRDIVTDFNLPYMIHSRLIPQYDLGIATNATMVDGSLTAQDDTWSLPDIGWCSAAGDCGNIVKGMGGVGGRDDLGLIPRWQSDFLNSMGHPGVSISTKLNAWNKLIIRTADTTTSMPIHYMETDAGANRDSPADGQRYYFHYPANTTDRAFGRILSINARPTVWNLSTREWTATDGVNAADHLVAVCSPSTSPCGPDTDRNGWALDMSHWPATVGLSYLLTGNPFYQRQQYYSVSWMFAWLSWARANGSHHRSYEWGLVWSYNHRSRAWVLRELMYAALIAQEPERSYFAEKLRNNDELEAGWYNITDGVYPPGPCTAPFSQQTETNIWCFGRNATAKAMNGWNPTISGNDNPLGIPNEGFDSNANEPFDLGVDRANRQYMIHYTTIVYNWIWEMGAFEHGGKSLFEGVRRGNARYMLGIVHDPDSYAPYYNIYAQPVAKIDGGARRYLNTWAEWTESFYKSGTLNSAINSTDTAIQITVVPANINSPMTATPNTLRIGNELIRYCTWSAPANPSNIRNITVCAGGRGMWGTDAVAHNSGAVATQVYSYPQSGDANHGYALISMAAYSFLTDLKYGGKTGRAAFEWIRGFVPNQQIVATNNRWYFAPRDEVRYLRTKVSEGSVRLRWLAPSGAGCKVYFDSTEPTDSFDASDATVTGGSPEQTYLVSDLTAGTYHYRITCGTGRVRGTVTAP